MHPDDVIAALRERPFRPFRIHVSDGATYDVRHPEMVIVGRRTLIIGLPGVPDRPQDRIATVALIHVARLEHLELEARA